MVDMVVFPENIRPEPVGGPGYSVSVQRYPVSGRESRNLNRESGLLQWQVGLDGRDIAEVHQVISFFRARRGNHRSFLYKDWADFQTVSPDLPISPTDQVLGVGDGTNKVFNLVTTYPDDGGNPEVRRITYPVSGSVRVALDAVEKTETTDWSINYTDGSGQITFVTAPGPGVQVTWGGQFYVPVRFVQSLQQISLRTFQSGEWPTLDIVEVTGE